RTRIVKIGNAHGVRIPKPLIDQMGWEGEVEVSVQRDRIVISPPPRPRADWDEQFRAMAELGDDELLDAPTPTQWDQDEWQW
ncbi:MAG: AbrB/MazE/SpoVT family DNA-binding domain-containing protein, partial [Pseudomonadota bacterium]